MNAKETLTTLQARKQDYLVFQKFPSDARTCSGKVCCPGFSLGRD